MIFAILLFASAFLLEGVATYMSISGLIATFSMSWAIITLAAALDIAKLTAVTFVYKYWERVHKAMKAYLLPSVFVLMLITGVGSYGFLIEHFQSAIQNNKESNVKIQLYTEEKAKLEARKIQIDDQVAKLPENFVKGRQKLLASFKDELAHINSRTIELDKEIPKLKLEQVAQDTHVGPIAVVAKVFNTDLEVAIQFIVILIVFVMDPLAVVLILAGNRLLELRKEDKESSRAAKQQNELEEERFKIEKERLRLAEKEVALEETKIEAKMKVIEENPEELLKSELTPVKDVTEIVAEAIAAVQTVHTNADVVDTSMSHTPSIYRELYAKQSMDDDRSEEINNEESEEITYNSGHVFEPVDLGEPEPTIATPEKLKSLVQPMESFPEEEEIVQAIEEVPASALDDVKWEHIKFFTEETGGHNVSTAYKLYKDEGLPGSR